MLHVWLMPVIGLGILAVVIFYLIVKFKGGSGVRTEGRTLHDEPGDEEDQPGSPNR